FERMERARRAAEEESATEPESSTPTGEDPPSAAADDPPVNAESSAAAPEPRRSLYDQFAERAGECDYETYWERHFEHNIADNSYPGGTLEFGKAIRELEEDSPRWRAENLVREAFMRRRIAEVIAAGHAPDKIVAVVGAFHAPVLTGEFPSMTDAELASLRK